MIEKKFLDRLYKAKNDLVEKEKVNNKAGTELQKSHPLEKDLHAHYARLSEVYLEQITTIDKFIAAYLVDHR